MIICCSRHATDHKAHSQHYVLRTHSDDAATAGLGLGAGCRLGTVAPIQTLRVLDSEAEIETAQLARPSRLPTRYFFVTGFRGASLRLLERRRIAIAVTALLQTQSRI